MKQHKADIGRRIRGYRLLRKLTQIQLAGKVGLDTTTICKIEKGHTSGSLDSLSKIAAALGVSVTDLLDEPKTGTNNGRRANVYRAIRCHQCKRVLGFYRVKEDSHENSGANNGKDSNKGN